jgi:uncharacterized membrane protein YqjE
MLLRGSLKQDLINLRLRIKEKEENKDNYLRLIYSKSIELVFMLFNLVQVSLVVDN